MLSRRIKQLMVFLILAAGLSNIQFLASSEITDPWMQVQRSTYERQYLMAMDITNKAMLPDEAYGQILKAANKHRVRIGKKKLTMAQLQQRVVYDADSWTIYWVMTGPGKAFLRMDLQRGSYWSPELAKLATEIIEVTAKRAVKQKWGSSRNSLEWNKRLNLYPTKLASIASLSD